MEYDCGTAYSKLGAWMGERSATRHDFRGSRHASAFPLEAIAPSLWESARESGAKNEVGDGM